MTKSITVKTPQHKNHKKNNNAQHPNKPWETLEHHVSNADTVSKQRLQKHFPERMWHIGSEGKKGPKI